MNEIKLKIKQLGYEIESEHYRLRIYFQGSREALARIKSKPEYINQLEARMRMILLTEVLAENGQDYSISMFPEAPYFVRVKPMIEHQQDKIQDSRVLSMDGKDMMQRGTITEVQLFSTRDGQDVHDGYDVTKYSGNRHDGNGLPHPQYSNMKMYLLSYSDTNKVTNNFPHKFENFDESQIKKFCQHFHLRDSEVAEIVSLEKLAANIIPDHRVIGI